jgi:hypothetical protein
LIIGFWEKPPFFSPKVLARKSQKTVILTSTPGHPARQPSRALLEEQTQKSGRQLLPSLADTPSRACDKSTFRF